MNTNNALTILDQGPPALPAELIDQLEQDSNLPEKVTVPSMSYSGKVWSIMMNGEKTRIEGKNQDGDLVPLPVMRVIVLDWAKQRGRAYYPGTYDSAKTAMPESAERPAPPSASPTTSPSISPSSRRCSPAPTRCSAN